MTFRRLAVSLVSVCVLLACSDDDAVVALNVTAADNVPVVDRLHVTITQGSRRLVHDFTPPVETGMAGAGPSIKNGFFERITLPEDFDDADALVHVEALQAGAVPFEPALTSETTVPIEEDGAVAAYVTLAFPAPLPAPDAGVQAGAGGEAGAGDASGAPSGGGAGG
jgi:hypothetical protein